MTMLFRKAETTSAYLKVGFMGLAGSGKTFTATSVAIGMVEMLRKLNSPAGDKPIFFLDTEKGSDWIKPRVEQAGIELFTAKTRAFSDLVAAVKEAEANSSLLLVDSLTHFWVELGAAYMKSKNRTRLQFEDWNFLKSEWRKFTDAFINSSVHILLCGRAGYEYDYLEDEDTGKKNLTKTGIKMKAESEMGYEPDLLILMERVMNMKTMTNEHVATIQKDRSTLLDGREFPNPTFETFLPHVQCLNLGGRQMGIDMTRTSEHTIPQDIRDNRRTQRKIVLAEIEDLLVLHYPSTAAKDKAAKIALLRKFFTASWTEMEEVMPLEPLRIGYDAMHIELEGKPSRYGSASLVAAATATPKVSEIDSLPDHSAKPDPLDLPPELDRRPVKANGHHAPSQTDPSWVEAFATH